MPARVDPPELRAAAGSTPPVPEVQRLASVDVAPVAAAPVAAPAPIRAAPASRAAAPKPAASRVSAPARRANPSVAQGIREFTVPASEPPGDTLVAILDESTIVVANPLGVPTPVRVGQRLPSGATLLHVDPQTQSAVTHLGRLRLEQPVRHAP
jgi:hypothetical protein